MEQTNFLRRFDKPDLNFQEVYTDNQSSGHIHIQSEIITHIRTALSCIFQQFKKPAKYKNNSQTAKSHLLSQNFSLNLFCQLSNARTAKKTYRGSLNGSEPQSINQDFNSRWQTAKRPIHWANLFFSTSGRLRTTLIFNKRCDERRSEWHA